MKRRQFLHTAGAGISIPVFLNGLRLSASPATSIFSNVNPDIDRVLVLIQLNGGNDGLQMILPLDQYDNLFKVRENIIIPENQIVDVTDKLGFHPGIKGMKWLYDEGKLGVVQSVGYPNQNRSHFRSTDIWTSGSPADEFWTTGWLGRNFDNWYAGYPENYPNETYPDPFAITMGSIVSETCQGVAANYSMTLNDPFSLSPLMEGTGSQVPDTPYGEELEFLRITIAQTNAYSKVITKAAEKGLNSANYPEDNGLARQLKNVALLISGGLRTKVYVCSMGGFDTHANQVLGDNTVGGEHATLLSTLSEAIVAFQEDIEKLGIENKVMGMTFSEFGRRIKSNDSLGTDHGTAAPLILFGACVNATVTGANPEISPDVDNNEGVPMQIDFRDVYGSILEDWFELDKASVKSLLHEEYQNLDIVIPCRNTTSTKDRAQEALEKQVNLTSYPNPFEEWTTISFQSGNEWVRLSIFDALGSEVQVLVNQKLQEGLHQINWESRGFPAGTYFYRLQLSNGVHLAKRFVKIR